MYGRFEYYGVADIDREMTEASLTEAATRFELVYQTGGTGGPYPSLDKAKQYAERLLKGGKDRWIAVIDAKQVNDLKRAKVLWLLKRDGGWEKGPRPLPNVPPTTQYKEDLDGLEEARGTQTISMGQMMDLKRDPKAKQMVIRGAPGGPFAGFEVKTFPSREKMIEFLKKQAKKPTHGALGARDWKAVVKDKVGKNMVAYPSYQQESLFEARSTPVKGKKGKYKYKGKVGVWRTLDNGDKVFFPDDKSGPLAMRGPTKAKSKKPGLLKRIGGAIKRAFTREELEAELERLEASSSPFPEVRERRIAELRTELEEESVHDQPPKIGQARYAKGKMLVQTPSTTGFKSRAARLAGAIGGRWTNRERGYVMSPKQAEKLRKLYADGWDAEFISGWGKKRPDLVPPKRTEGEETELAVLESSDSPFPEVRERRIAELRTELEEAREARHTTAGHGPRSSKNTGGKAVKSTDERKPGIVAAFKRLTKSPKITQVRDLGGGVFSANCLSQAVGGEGKICKIRLDLESGRGELIEAKKVPPEVLGRLGGDGRGRGLGRGRPGRGLGVGKPEGGRGLGPGKGKGPFRGTGMGPGTGTCENLRAQVDEVLESGQAAKTIGLRLSDEKERIQVPTVKVIGPLAVHREVIDIEHDPEDEKAKPKVRFSRAWSISHIKSGRSVSTLDRKGDAIKLAEKIVDEFPDEFRGASPGVRGDRRKDFWKLKKSFGAREMKSYREGIENLRAQVDEVMAEGRGRASWTETGGKVVKFLRGIAKKYSIRLDDLNPTRIGAFGGNSVHLQYEPRITALASGWDKNGVITPFRVKEILKKWGADSPEEVVRKSQKAYDDDLRRVQGEWRHIASQIESRYPPFKADVTIKDGKSVDLEVKGRFMMWG